MTYTIGNCFKFLFLAKSKMLNSPVSLLENAITMPYYIHKTSVIQYNKFLKEKLVDTQGMQGVCVEDGHGVSDHLVAIKI